MMDFIVIYYNVTIKTAYSIENYFIPCKQGADIESATAAALAKISFCDQYEIIKVVKATPEEVAEHHALYNSLTDEQKADLIAGRLAPIEILKGVL